MGKRYRLRLPSFPCPNLKHLLEYKPEEIDKAFHCCGGTRLHHLVSKGLDNEVLQLLNKGADVDLEDQKGRTSLHVAVTSQYISSHIIKLIAENTLDIDVEDGIGKTALHLSVTSANSEVVKILLQLGADIDIPDRYGNAPLHCAFHYSLGLVEILVENGANVEVKNKNGETPLHIAVGAYEVGCMDVGQLTNIISILLDKGANINEQTKDGRTILHMLGCFRKKHANINELHTFLLNKGAQVHLQDRVGVTPLYLAVKQKAEYLGIMLRTESGKSAVNIPDNQRNYPLLWATKQRDYETVKLLLDNGAVIDVKNEYDETSLYLALEDGEISELIFNLLIIRGAQVSCKNKYLKTPLHVACDGAFVQQKLICITLLAMGASPNVQDAAGMTPLHYAVKRSSKKIVQLLVMHGANVGVKNKYGETPLHAAVSAYKIGCMDVGQLMNIIIILLNKEANINEQTKDGKTILHILGCFRKKPDHINELHTFLLNKGAQVHLQDREGVTPLYLAIKQEAEYLGWMLRTESGKSAVNIPDNQRNYPLLWATKQRDYEMVKILLDNGAVIDVKNEYDETPLYLALEDGEISELIFNLLIDRGAQVSCRDKYMRTPLHIVIKRALGQQNLICTTLLNRGASPNVQDAAGMTPLHYAVESNSKDIVQLLVENGADVNIKDKKGETTLHISTRHSFGKNSGMQDQICTILLDMGASINVLDDDGSTPLHNAVTYNNINLVQLLLEHGADVNSENKNGETPLHVSTRHSLDSNTGLQELICIILLDMGASINVLDDDGSTPLHNAVTCNNINLVQLLLEHGADVNSKNKNGETPLHVSTRHSLDSNTGLQELICKNLLGKGVLPNVQNVYGNTPLHNAVKNYTSNIIQLLIENGSELNIKNNKGETPLHLSTGECSDIGLQELTCSTLIAEGALINVQDNFGMTPLHNAVKGFSANIVHLLLENGADLNCKNKKGELPIRYVRYVDNFEVLLQKGAEVNEQDIYGRTALHNVAKDFLMKRYLPNLPIPLRTSSKVVKLLEWGASQNIKDNLGNFPFDYYSFTEAQEEYEIKRTCLYSTYQVGRGRSNSYYFQKLHKSCCEEIDRMKLEKLGKSSLYDIFRHYDDPHFLSNGELESAVLSKDLKVYFPVYYSMLTSTYLRSRVRVQLFHRVVDILQTPLPFEVMRYILTFVDDDSLNNVIKAKEEPSVKEKTDTASKSGTEPGLELNSEDEPDSEYEFNGECESDEGRFDDRDFEFSGLYW